MEKVKSSEEVIANYLPRIEEWLKHAYNEGYRNGNEIKQEYLNSLRSECHREKGEQDEEYQKGWGDYSCFYGWCCKCKKPHSGRWAHIWSFCPWCGSRIEYREDDPYPTGVKFYPDLLQELQEMCADINPEEIKSHDTDESLKGWCGAWNRRMNKLISHIGDSISE